MAGPALDAARGESAGCFRARLVWSRGWAAMSPGPITRDPKDNYAWFGWFDTRILLTIASGTWPTDLDRPGGDRGFLATLRWNGVDTRTRNVAMRVAPLQ